MLTACREDIEVKGGNKERRGAREILGGSHGGVCPIGPILQTAPPRLGESSTTGLDPGVNNYFNEANIGKSFNDL